MRSLRLARLAAKAELLRLRQLLRRQAIRGLFALAAAVFLFAALACLHVAAALALAARMTPVQAVLILAAVDAVIAIVLLAVAARDRPGAVEREALAVRKAAVEQTVEAALVAAFVARLRRIRSLRDMFDVVAAAFAGWVFGARR